MVEKNCWLGQKKWRRALCPFALLVSGIVLSGMLGAAGVVSEPAAGSRLQSMRVDGYFDPGQNFLDATARLRFSGPAGARQFWLANELQLRWVRGGRMTVEPFASETGLFVVQCPPENELEFSYSGRLASKPDPFEPSPKQGTPGESDDLRFLSYITDYYPHPQLDFASMEMNMRIPSGWNCLGSGTLRAVQSTGGGNTYSFANSEAKGMSLVCGRFQQLARLPGTVPIRLHGWAGFDYRRCYSDAGLARLISFYQERFGALGVPELNILFRRGQNFGGISYSGLIVLNVDDDWTRFQSRTRSNPGATSLLALDNAWNDLMAHELAHQWWGGLVSWETVSDNWITEGLATYSSLLFLKECRGEKAFARVLRRLRNDVKRYAGLGVPADGSKLKLLHRDIRIYQALVYAKPALMLAALADTIGEAELCRRLRSFLADRRGRNVGTLEFLERMSAGDDALRLRLEAWISARGLPERL